MNYMRYRFSQLGNVLQGLQSVAMQWLRANPNPSCFNLNPGLLGQSPRNSRMSLPAEPPTMPAHTATEKLFSLLRDAE